MNPVGDSHKRPKLITDLILVATVSWIVVILAFLSFTQAFDPYWYIAIPRIATAINTGLIAPGSNTPGWDAIVAEFSIVLGLPLRILLFLPIGGLLLSIMAYVFIRRLEFSPVASALFVACLAVSMLGSSTYSIFAHAWGFPMLFAVLLCLVGFAQGSRMRVPWATLLAILFIALHLVYYTAELLAMLFVLAFAFFAGLSKMRPGEGDAVRAPVSLAVALFVIFTVFNQTVYQVYLPSISQSSVGESFSWFSAQLVGLLQGTRSHPQPYQLGSSGNIVTESIGIAQVLVIGAPILLFLFYPVYRYVKQRRFALPIKALDSAIVFSLLITSIGDFVVYFFLGVILLRTVYLLLPAAGGLIFRGVGEHASQRWRALPLVFLAVLLVLSAALLPARTASGMVAAPSTLAEVEPGASWFLEVQQADYGGTLTDLRTATRLTLIASESGGTYMFQSYNSLLYGAILGSPGASLNRSGVRYVVVDVRSLSAPVYAYGWDVFEPLVTYYPGINHNPALSKVYDDSSMAVFVNAA